jgi:hypothetical protein
VRIAYFNSNRGPGCFMESLSHGFESTAAWNERPDQIPYLSRHFRPFAGYDLDGRYGTPFDSWYACDSTGPAECMDYPTPTSVSYRLAGESGSISPFDAVCGNVHFMPNGRFHYDLTSADRVRTTCEHFRLADGVDGADAREAFATSMFSRYTELAPDCMGAFLVYWWQNAPGLNNPAIDDTGEHMLNWWPFIYY